jgi:hypothetical protein
MFLDPLLWLAKAFRGHLRAASPPMRRAPRGFTVGEGPLAAASPQDPLDDMSRQLTALAAKLSAL